MTQVEKLAQLDAVVFECHRFIGAVMKYRQRLTKDGGSAVYSTKEGATCKRASMDLSNILIELRRS